jgi:hypothetical protein
MKLIKIVEYGKDYFETIDELLYTWLIFLGGIVVGIPWDKEDSIFILILWILIMFDVIWFFIWLFSRKVYWREIK